MRINTLLESSETQRYYERINALLPDMQAADESGEIVKPRFEEWKDWVSRLCDAVKQEVRDEFVNARKYESLPEQIRHFDFGMGAVGAKSIPNKIAKLKLSPELQNHPFTVAILAAYNQLKPLLDLTDSLKGKVVTTTAKREQAKEVKDKEAGARFNDAASLTNVLMQHKEAYVQRAEEAANAQYTYWTEQLTKAEWNLDTLAPRPDYKKDGDDVYKRKSAIRGLYQKITKKAEGAGYDSSMVQINPEAKEKHIKDAKRGADDAYMAWVHKMIAKIGKPVTKATMTGDPWRHSTIQVTCDDGEAQTWESKMILNQSKYGTLFNQFPSRRSA